MYSIMYFNSPARNVWTLLTLQHKTRFKACASFVLDISKCELINFLRSGKKSFDKEREKEKEEWKKWEDCENTHNSTEYAQNIRFYA